MDSFCTVLDKNGASVKNRTLHGHTGSALFTLAHYLPHWSSQPILGLPSQLPSRAILQEKGHVDTVIAFKKNPAALPRLASSLMFAKTAVETILGLLAEARSLRLNRN